MNALTHHQLAAISIAGSFLDVLGALYLAYDILGGKHGPLRTMTRMVTYGVIFGVGYGIPLGLAFGISMALTGGLTIGLELSRAATGLGPYPLRVEILFALIRSLGFGVGAAFTHGTEFGLAFAALSAIVQTAAYVMGSRPEVLASHKEDGPVRLPLTWRNAIAAVARILGFGLAGYASAAIAHHQMHAAMFGRDIGLATGAITAVFNLLAPYIEWGADNMPDKRMGVFGVLLILVGFSLQSVQYWVALFDVPVR